MCILQPAEGHLEQFRQALDQEHAPWMGKAPQNWARHVTGETRSNLPVERQDRYALREWLTGNSLEDQLLAVCAWGGMQVGRKEPREGHGRAMWSARDNFMWLLRELPSLDRREAYERFHALRPHLLPGMGPAYFTKLIHFMGPANGYILDQWTARAINLLFGKIIHLKRVTGGWQVTDQNSAGHYERYCRCVERLAVMLTADPSEVEYALFAPGMWREHLLAQTPADGPVAPFCEEDWQG